MLYGVLLLAGQSQRGADACSLRADGAEVGRWLDDDRRAPVLAASIHNHELSCDVISAVLLRR